ncbi:hypothetical protein, partial [Thiohalocapsa marina]|uniref:hypothetical protein n=1 Tax=Thiohalocapsa marina TaxID=424902 RepID=UPI0036D88475
AGDFLDPHGLMHDVINQARARYRRLAEKVQGVFVKHVESLGWPLTGRLANADVFDRLVADRLKESGRKVAYLMVDALRYELGVVARFISPPNSRIVSRRMPTSFPH